MSAARGVAAGLLCLVLIAPAIRAAPGPAVDASLVSRGEAIYLRGVLASGALLEGEREAGGPRGKGAPRCRPSTKSCAPPPVQR